MRRILCALAIFAAMAGDRASAHHSYSAYERDRFVEVDGVVDQFKVMSPHTLLIVKGPDGQLYTGEWLASQALKRSGIDAATLQVEQPIVIRGNPRRDFGESRIMNLKGVLRPSDGWAWGQGALQQPTP
jgi:hypothetical protein